jgi:hypothetical protein
MVGSFFFNIYQMKLLGCVAYGNKLLQVGIGDGFSDGFEDGLSLGVEL